MSLPWSEMMNLINLDNQRNPAPSPIVTQPTTSSHRFNPYKKPSSISKEETNSSRSSSISNTAAIDSDLAALHRWIDQIMAEPDVPEPDFFKPVACKDSAGNEIKMKNAQGKNLIRPLRDYSGLFDPTQPLPENPNLSTGKGENKSFWFWLLQILIDPSMREIAAWTGRGREFIILNDNAFAEVWSRHIGRSVPVDFDSIRRTIRTHYKRDILIPADTKSRKNRRWAFYTEPSIHVGMTRDELSAYITAYNTNSPPSSVEKMIEEVPSHHYPTPAPSTESFFNFSAPPSPNSQFQVLPPHSYPHHFNVTPSTAEFPEFSFPHPEHPSHFQSPPIAFEQTQNFSIPSSTDFTDPCSIELLQMPEYSFPLTTAVEMSQSPEPVIDQPISNIEQPEPLPVLDINEFDLEFDDSWSSPVSLEDLNVEAENGGLLDGLFF